MFFLSNRSIISELRLFGPALRHFRSIKTKYYVSMGQCVGGGWGGGGGSPTMVIASCSFIVFKNKDRLNNY